MQQASDDELARQNVISPDDFHDCIPRVREVAGIRLHVPTDLNHRLKTEASDLLLPSDLLDECAAALLAGHVVLQGPPGTGKSSLARALARAYGAELLAVTAHEDWSTFEVIGRQELRVSEGGQESIVPVNGHFTEAVVRCAGCIPRFQDDPDSPQATWLLIDELNRAHPDKAFGELFSVLGTDDPVEVTLGYQRPGNDTLVVPRRFRIIATVNSVDKQFVHSLSHGLRRRFTFLTVDVPPRRPEGEDWDSLESLAAREYATVAEKAEVRAAHRLEFSAEEYRSHLSLGGYGELLVGLFELVERVRYAEGDDRYPYVPVGTASLIDTVELALIRGSQGSEGKPTDANLAMAFDWAFSVRIAPLFDAGGVSREKLHALASDLQEPFTHLTRRSLLTIESDGMFHVPVI